MLGAFPGRRVTVKRGRGRLPPPYRNPHQEPKARSLWHGRRRQVREFGKMDSELREKGCLGSERERRRADGLFFGAARLCAASSASEVRGLGGRGGPTV